MIEERAEKYPAARDAVLTKISVPAPRMRTPEAAGATEPILRAGTPWS
jgi:hypothetical protein